MKNLSSCIYQFITNHSKGFELSGILATLLIISYQSYQTQMSIKEMQKNYTRDVNKMIHEHKQRVNKILMAEANEDLRKSFQTKKEDLLYFLMVNDYANLYQMNKLDLIQGDQWEDTQEMMVSVMATNKKLYSFWSNQKKFFNSKFVKYIEPLIEKRLKNSTIIPSAQQTADAKQ